MNNNVKFSVKDLNLYYGKFHALKDIDMDIPANEVTAFIGIQKQAKIKVPRNKKAVYVNGIMEI